MAYVKKIWEDYPDTTTQIKAEYLNNIENGIEAVDTVVNGGWAPLTGTFTYSSADSPTFVMSTSVDLTGIVGLGMRIKLTQATTKYFIVTAITTSSITMYGGTDYTLTSNAISNVYYSMLKAPYGFPLEESKWSIILIDSNERGKTSPTTNVFYNLGALSITIPRGLFRIYTDINLQIGKDGDPFESKYAQYTLSTTTNSITNSEFNIGIAGYGEFYRSFQFKRNIISLNSKTTFYLLMRVLVGSYNLYFVGAEIPTKIQAVCAYL